jgi:hypothetical protein
MSPAMQHIHSQMAVDVVSPFTDLDEFRTRFRKFRTLAGMPDWTLNRLDRLLLYALDISFWKDSPSVTHRYRLGRRAQSSEGSRLRWVFNKLFFPIPSPLLFAASKKMMHHYLRFSPLYRFYKNFFRKQKVAKVVTAHAFSRNEFPALVAAKDLGLKTVAIITSWDNITSKAPLIIDFDQYLVWNRIMAQEVSDYYRIPSSRVCEIGPPQFDFYFDPSWSDSRQDFCARFGFDPERQIVVHSTVTPGLLPDEPLLVEKLLLALKEGRITGDPNVMIRLHPKRGFEDFSAVSEDPRWQGLRVAWTVAGPPVREGRDRWCPMDAEIRLLTNTVVHGDVNLNVFSTMLLDFAVLGKPAVLICHDAADRKLPYDGFEHLKPVLECRGHRIGYTFAETLAHLNAYLQNPSLDAAGRQRLVELECGRFLGRSWERLAAVLLNGRGGPASLPGMGEYVD